MYAPKCREYVSIMLRYAYALHAAELSWWWIRLSELCRSEVSPVVGWGWVVCDDYSGFLWRSNTYTYMYCLMNHISRNEIELFPELNMILICYCCCSYYYYYYCDCDCIALHCIRLQNTTVGVHMWICWKLSRNKIKTQFGCSAFIHIYIFSLIVNLNY